MGEGGEAAVIKVSGAEAFQSLPGPILNNLN